MKNIYAYRSRISERKIREIIRCFAVDLTALQTAELTGVNRNTVNRIRPGFSMMRGGHLDIAVLGAYQVAENGDLANWATLAEKFSPAVGGAMDLVVGVPEIFVLMRHTDRNGLPKVLKRCTYPLTGTGVVTRVYTDLCVLEVAPDGFQLIELAPGNSLEEVQRMTEARIISG